MNLYGSLIIACPRLQLRGCISERHTHLKGGDAPNRKWHRLARRVLPSLSTVLIDCLPDQD